MNTIRLLSTSLGIRVAMVMVMAGLWWPIPAAGADHWVWPLSPRPIVVNGFDAPDPDWQAGHRGVDLAGTLGESVLAIGAGRVTYAGSVAGVDVVVVRHGVLRSTYEPVLATVSVGDHVFAGEPIGDLELFGSHCLPDACLHLGVKNGSRYLDPLSLFGPRQVRLLPLQPDAAPEPDQPGADARQRPSTPRPPPIEDAGHPGAGTGWPTVVTAFAVTSGALGLAWSRRRHP